MPKNTILFVEKRMLFLLGTLVCAFMFIVNYLKCPHCDMTCPNPGSLKYHIHYRHSDERPYPCAMCDHR